MVDTDRLVHFTQSLIRAKSPTGDESQVAKLVSEEMRALRFDHVWIDHDGNTIGVIEGEKPGPTLLLDAHADTVGIAPGAEWTQDPFAANIVEGHLFGRGAADMKGALAAMVQAAADVDRQDLMGRVVVCASVMEEVMEGYGLRAVMEALHPDMVVIGESTDLNLNRGGRGRAELKIETIGRPAHTSSPAVGLSAVDEMIKVIEGLKGMELPSDPLLGPAIIALTDLISDPYPGHSVIPSRCRATFDRRVLPGDTPEMLIEQIRSLAALQPMDMKVELASGEYQTFNGTWIRGPKFFPAWVFDEGHPFVRTALEGLRSTGLKPAMGAYRFCTNAAYSAGVAAIPTVGFGPGCEEDAHVVDERLALEDLELAAQGYRGIIQAALGAG